MEQGRKSLGEIFISGTEREALPLVAPVLCHCSISSSSFWSVCRGSVTSAAPSSPLAAVYLPAHLISPPAPKTGVANSQTDEKIAVNSAFFPASKQVERLMVQEVKHESFLLFFVLDHNKLNTFGFSDLVVHLMSLYC